VKKSEESDREVIKMIIKKRDWVGDGRRRNTDSRGGLQEGEARGAGGDTRGAGYRPGATTTMTIDSGGRTGLRGTACACRFQLRFRSEWRNTTPSCYSPEVAAANDC